MSTYPIHLDEGGSTLTASDSDNGPSLTGEVSQNGDGMKRIVDGVAGAQPSMNWSLRGATFKERVRAVEPDPNGPIDMEQWIAEVGRPLLRSRDQLLMRDRPIDELRKVHRQLAQVSTPCRRVVVVDRVQSTSPIEDLPRDIELLSGCLDDHGEQLPPD